MDLPWRRFKFRVLVAATLATAAILASIVIVPQWLSKQARLEVLRSHVGQIAQLAASVVDGDLHRQLLDTANYSPELYAQALHPLVRFHSANPEIFYVYTMVERAGTTYFVLDTAASPDLRRKHDLQPSAYMERFVLRPEYASDWLQQIASGNTWVTPSFQQDDYGNFLSAHAPIYDSQGRYSGFVGVDFDLQYYLAQEALFRRIGLWSLTAAMLVALLIGYFAARYHFTLQNRVEEHYNISVRDDLTGLLNRRGALDAISRAIARRAPSYAALLVDIDDLKRINDTYGHVAGDTLIVDVAQSIRNHTRKDDVCARLGGDEFMIFATDCDGKTAADMAAKILAAAAPAYETSNQIVPSVSIGIAIQDHQGANFDRMYRQADDALYQAKSRGKRSFTVYEVYTSSTAV